MAKKPYIEFYPGDWARDAGVRKLSLEEKGAWLEILIAMDDNEPRGELQGNVQGLSRLLGVDDRRGFLILDSLIQNKVTDVLWESPSDETDWHESKLALTLALSKDCLNMSAGSPPIVPYFWLTLRSRRMWREEAKKRKWREEKREQRDGMSDDCPRDVTPSRARSSSSSSSSKEYMADFESWWKDYPNKAGKTRALDHYAHWRKTESAESLLRALHRYIAKKKRENSNTFAHGSTFLNPNPRGDSANISDFLGEEDPCCGTCTHGGYEPTYCVEAGQTVNPDDTPCEKHEERNGTPATS